jgi:hypothetical protein
MIGYDIMFMITRNRFYERAHTVDPRGESESFLHFHFPVYTLLPNMV